MTYSLSLPADNVSKNHIIPTGAVLIWSICLQDIQHNNISMNANASLDKIKNIENCKFSPQKIFVLKLKKTHCCAIKYYFM